MKIKTIAIANRGEVAVRIIRACQEMNIKTVLLHSEVDMGSRAYRLADKKICIGPAPTSESYLNIEKNVQGALAAGADAIHPGFGFLSENAEFSRACEKAGLIFIGPRPESIKKLGDKVACKALAEGLGLSLIPGYQGKDQNVDKLYQEAEKLGFPVLVKAAAGGGGRGMKILKNSAEAKELIQSAQREALSAFGSDIVFLEKYLTSPKHIEFQIFADCTGRVMHLFDRECSIQRRHQKIIEEALSPSLTQDLRMRMGTAACSLVEAAGYRGAGTVEFLLQDGQFYFLEMNTRLQVEHPVTELVLGVDLVKAQILTAQGEAVFPGVLSPRGHAIECRLYAEDPYLGGVPSTGILGKIHWPDGPGRRFDFGFEAGDEITTFYDPMIAKIIVWDETRPRAIEKMKRTLHDSIVFGVQTNIPYLLEILSHPEFINGTMTTQFIEKYLSGPLPPLRLTDEDRALAESLSRSTSEGASASPFFASAGTACDENVVSQRWKGQLWIHFGGKSLVYKNQDEMRYGQGVKNQSHARDIVAPMPGKVTRIAVKEKDFVRSGDVVAVMEAMKMEYTLKAEGGGQVESVSVQVGDQVALGKVLVQIKAES